MSATRFLLPPQGNPMRPVILLLAFFFTVMLVAFPVLMYYVGLGTGSIVGIALLIVATAALCIGVTAWTSRGIERDRVHLDATDALASWWLSVDEYRRFVAFERRKNIAWSAGYLVFGLALAAFFSFRADDQITAIIMVAAFALAAGVKLALGGPPWRATDEAREVRIGTRGVQVLGRYTPFAMTLTRLQSVELQHGDPAVITFWVKSGRQLQDIRVPVTQGRWDEAEALVERFRQALTAT